MNTNPRTRLAPLRELLENVQARNERIKIVFTFDGHHPDHLLNELISVVPRLLRLCDEVEDKRRATPKKKAPSDPLRAELRALRGELKAAMTELRATREGAK